MSYIRYISLPVRPSALPKPVADEGLIENPGIYYYPDMSQGYRYLYMCPDSPECEGGVYFGDKGDATFSYCFKNPFVFGFVLDGMVGSQKRCFEIVHSDMPNKIKDREIEKIHAENQLWKRRKLYEFLHRVLKVGEFVEIFTGWLHFEGPMFPPPVGERVIDVEDILCYDKVPSLWGAMIYKEDEPTAEHLLTIRRTV